MSIYTRISIGTLADVLRHVAVIDCRAPQPAVVAASDSAPTLPARKAVVR